MARLCCRNFFIIGGVLIGGGRAPWFPLATPMLQPQIQLHAFFWGRGWGVVQAWVRISLAVG